MTTEKAPPGAADRPTTVASAPPGAGATAVPALDDPRALSRGELQDRAIRGAMWTLVHVVVSLPLAFVVNIVIARVLGVVDYGRLAYLSTVLALVGSAVEFGVGTGVVQFGSKAHAAGRYDEVKRMLTAAQGYRVLVGIPVLSLAVLLLVDVDPVLLAIALVFGVVIPCASGGPSDALAIENKTAQSAQATMIVNLVTQVMVVIVAATVGTADSIWAVRLVAVGLGAIAYMCFVAPMYRRALLRPRFRRFPPGFWKFAVPAGAAGMLEAFVSSRSEVLVLTWMSEPAAAGVFALAFGLGVHLFAPAQSLLGPLVPAISGLREVDVEAVGRALGRTLRASSTATAAVVAAATPAFALLVPTIYGPEFASVPPVLVVLSIAGGLLVMAGPLKAFLMARLKGTWLLWMNLACLVVDVGLTVALVRPLGVWAAVLGNATAAVVLFAGLLTLEVRSLGLSAGRTLGTVLPFLLGAAVSVVTWWGIDRIGAPPVPSAVLAGVLGLGLFVGAVRLARTGLTPADAEAVTRSVPARLRRVAAPMLRVVSASRA
ncbi:oligosaccharide flippase family protein [Isoptericola sp. NPDC057653]|uniref:oligosaccharide flippase family protein n=1 Tax=Isoptericola sp. NPDC057653 TaxID=3346195 RepID=UPI00367C37D4